MAAPILLYGTVSLKNNSYFLNNLLIKPSPKNNTIAQIIKNYQPSPFQYVVAKIVIRNYQPIKPLF